VLDGVDPRWLASRVATPFYAYSASAIRARIEALKAALDGLSATVCFAVKANPNLAVLRLMAAAGLGADIVSLGELKRALRAGIPPGRIVFSGVGKTNPEIDEALAAGIWKFNVESEQELRCLDVLAGRRGVVARAAARINPDVDAATHAKISTGKSANKFGVGPDEARRWFERRAEYPSVRLDGLHVHIGSQILDLAPLRLALGRVAALQRELTGAGCGIDSVNVGGGLGVRYRAGQPDPIAPADYVAAIREALAGYGGRIVLEPGRYLVAEAGVLLTRVVRVKPGGVRPFLVVDAAMNDFARPSLYDAWHDIVVVDGGSKPSARYDVVGPVCESADTFATDRELPGCEPGDLLMLEGAGAYGAAMASTYNSRPLPAEVLLDRGRYAIVRPRQTYEELMAGDAFPETWHA
jgi:diaminopimelate decarboxylase